MTQAENYARLYQKLMQNQCSPEEVEQMLTWLAAEQPDPHTKTIITSQLKLPVAQDAITADIRERLEGRLKNILKEPVQTAFPGKVRAFRTARWVAAASVLLLLGVAGFWWFSKKEKLVPVEQVAETSSQRDIAPGRNGAILTLSDGSNILLDSMGNGTISESGTNIQVENGKLSYRKGTEQGDAERFNTMTTPNGRQFNVVLPDGTTVWLNAASSLKYPTLFNGTERRVEVTGEAYFEVAKNAAMPFRVVVNNYTTIEVLGTGFNISAYEDDDQIKTTLVEGAVKVITVNSKNNNSQVILHPGQQARLSSPAKAGNSGINVVNNIDIGKVIAWKNGLFNFNGVKLEAAMKQLARWYDIQIIYEKGIPDIQFFGEVSRDVSLAGLLKGLEGAGVNFRIEEGKKLVVYP